MLPNDNSNLYLYHFISTIVGIGLEVLGYQLIHGYNQKKIGYVLMSFGLLILLVNAVYILMKVKK